METGEFWQKVPDVNRRTSVDQQLLSDLAALEKDLTNKKGLDRPSAQGLIGRSIFTQYLIDREIVTRDFLELQVWVWHSRRHTATTVLLRNDCSTGFGRLSTATCFHWRAHPFPMTNIFTGLRTSSRR